MGVVQANNEYIELQAKEQKEIDRILAEFSAEAAAHREDIQWDYDTLVHLDLIFARGQLSYKMNAVRPEVRRDGAIHLRKARHPLLDPKTAVPIDIELGDTGIVEKVAGGRVYTIEGNTSSAAGVVENGGCVQDKSYPLTYSKIGGYGRPDFSIVPEEDNDMDQTKFNEIFAAAMAEYRKQLRDNDSGDWSQKAREWAVSVGLFAGNGTLDNGEPNMMWEDFLTREQAAQLFYRFALEHGLA